MRQRLTPVIALSLWAAAASHLTLGAPCCGGTSNVPSLISGDDRSQVSATLLSSLVIADARVGGSVERRPADDREFSQTLKIDAATLLSDRWQVGISIPVTRRYRTQSGVSDSSSGLGDIALQLGYEALPNWDYSAWRPKGIVFLTTTLPTGGSNYDATQLYHVDSRGRGFFSVSLGTLWLKNFGAWDLSLLWEGHKAFPKSKNDPDLEQQVTYKPGFGTSGNVSFGVSPGGGNWRMGLALSPSYESAITTEGLVSGKGQPVWLWTSTAQLSYMASDLISLSLTYSDQTLFKLSENAALSRSIALVFQKRWER